MISSIFAERFNTLMQKKNMKQVDLIHLAQEQGVKLGKSQISQYVSGKTVPRKEMLQFLAYALQTDADWLLGQDAATSSISPKGDETMKTFKKSSKLDNVLYDVRGPVVEEAARMEQEGAQVLKLNIGNPAPFGFCAPDEVVFDMRRQLTDCEGYSDSKGLFSARKAIMQYAQLKNIPNVTMDGIYTGNGVSELINLSLSALLDSGDDEWGSLDRNSRMWILGASYVPAKNIEWTTLVEFGKRGIHSADTTTRNMFRTQVDFHF